MRCPACRIEMVVIEHQDVEIDVCHRCGGVWLDEGELEILLGAGQDASPFHDALDSSSAGEPGTRRCPVCSKKMGRIAIRLDTPVEIDKCPRKHGLWFDEGELQLVAAASFSGGAVAEFLNNTLECRLKKKQ